MKLRTLGTGFAAAVALAVAPALGLVAAPAASAAGDVCDICSVNFDLRLCEQLGGWAYDSTQEPAPPAVSGGAQQPAPQQPAPEQPAPQQPAPQQPQQQAPQQPQQSTPQQPQQPQQQSGTKSTTSTGSTQTGTAPSGEGTTTDAAVPAAPTGLTSTVDGRTLTVQWQAPADGGSPLTAYKLVINEGTPIELPADATTYAIDLAAGEYDIALLASNAVGDSPASETLTGIEVGASPSPRPSESADTAVLAAAPVSNSTPLVGGLVLGGFVLAAAGLLTWWWLRRRATTAAS